MVNHALTVYRTSGVGRAGRGGRAPKDAGRYTTTTRRQKRGTFFRLRRRHDKHTSKQTRLDEEDRQTGRQTGDAEKRMQCRDSVALLFVEFLQANSRSEECHTRERERGGEWAERVRRRQRETDRWRIDSDRQRQREELPKE